MYIPWLQRDVRLAGYLDLLWLFQQKSAQNSGDANPRQNRGGWFGFGQRNRPSGVPNTAQNVVPPPSGGSQVPQRDRPHLFALTIGINNYEDSNMPKLHGAVGDADDVKQFLEHDLKVSSDQIINLRNQQATRVGILKAFERLETDARIRKNDPILIYYAGHGSEVRSDRSNANSEMIQTIVPQNYSPNGVYPIPDRTVAALLDRLSDKHGNNITVIFDCCHSGSGTRGDEDPNSTVRGAKLTLDAIPDDLDGNICGSTRGLRVAEGFAQKGMRSHVLLAACSASELAREDREAGNGRGRFTTALLKLLRRVRPEQITYAEVLERLDPILGQNPQCEGYYRNRPFFDAKASSPGRICYAAKCENNIYTVEAGAAHGITDGAEFTLYASKEAVSVQPELAVMAIEKISPFFTTLKPRDAAIQVSPFTTAVAIQTKAGVAEDFRLYAPLQDRYLAVFEAYAKNMTGVGPNVCRIKLVPREEAQLEIAADANGRLCFNILDPRLTEYGFVRLPHTLKANSDSDDIKLVLRAAAHYHFHLNHTQPNTQIQNKISIEFIKLRESETDFDEDGLSMMQPDGPNLLRGGVLDLVVDDDLYGVKINNGTPWKLQFSCFFFDNSDFSITEFTESGKKGPFEKDFMLEARNGVAHLGYGSLGVPPFHFDKLSNDLSIGFLKFYFSTEAIDLSHIPQLSPFDGHRAVRQTVRKQASAWGTILIPVIQRRHRDSSRPQ